MNSELTHIGVVTVLYNSFDVVDDFIESLMNTRNVQLTLVAISNGNDALTLSKIEARISGSEINLHIIHNKKNLGVAAANNQGIAKCKEIGLTEVLIANNDVVFDSNCIAELVASRKTGFEAVSPVITYFEAPDKIWFAGGYLNYLTGRTVHQYIGKDTSIVATSDFKCGYAPTCFLLISVETLERCGLFDARYFVYYDDSDFFHRFNTLGFSLGISVKSRVKHKVSSSTGGPLSSFTIYHTIRNRLWFIKKNFNIPSKMTAILSMILSTAVRLVAIKEFRRREVLLGFKDGLFK